jgi:hypothetical protein
MVKLVIFINCTIALCGFYVAWQVWQVRGMLLEVEKNLMEMEEGIYLLSVTPQCLMLQRDCLRQLRQEYRQLELRLQQSQQILALVTLSQMLSRRYLRRLPKL